MLDLASALVLSGAAPGTFLSARLPAPGPVLADVRLARGRPRKLGAGWASSAGYAGLGAAGGVLVLSLVAEMSRDSAASRIPGIAATVLGGVAVPIVATGAASARGDEEVEGLPWMRTASWVLYGISLADAVAVLGLGFAEITPPGGLITSVGLLGASSLGFAAADAFASAAQAEELMLERESAGPR